MDAKSPQWWSTCRIRRWHLAPELVLAAILLVGTTGCTREFFREWANADVTEAVFQKSRDPRYRLDLFSIEPPALSRFADPGDPDFPNAPPDDLAASALSPTAQRPIDTSLIPIEGTGYLDQLEVWKAERLQEEAARESAEASGNSPRASVPEPMLPPEVEQGPFSPEGSESQNPKDATPEVDRPAIDPPNDPRPLEIESDDSLRPVALWRPQERGDDQPPTPIEPGDLPAEVTPPSFDTEVQSGETQPGDRTLSETVTEGEQESVSFPDRGNESGGGGGGLIQFLNAGDLVISDQEAAGYPAETEVYVVSPREAMTLALSNSRAYQTQVEDIYFSALPVTFQRFRFQPQVVAGLNPGGFSFGGGPGFTPSNSFLYRTAEAPGGQSSVLSTGPAAAVGKAFSFGGSAIASFGSAVVFNFVGLNPQQPEIQSIIPIQLVFPILRGGGRAVTMEPLTQAERSLLYQVRIFARFRKEFFTGTLVGAGFGNDGDPVVGYLSVLQALQAVENAARNVTFLENLLPIYSQLAASPDGAIRQLQLDQVDQDLQSGISNLLNSQRNYQNSLDSFRTQLGLPPDVPIVLDRDFLSGFREVFNRLEEWSEDPDRRIPDLENIVLDLPQFADIQLGDYSLKELSRPENRELLNDQLNDLLLTGERIALTNRLDLMNARAILFDAWRQLRITANDLQASLNISMNKQVILPPDTTNPLGFNSQSKQFTIQLNTDLPLVRIAERNAYQSARINYQRQRRALMQAEDALKLSVRSQIRFLLFNYADYELDQGQFLSSLKQKDSTLEDLGAPPPTRDPASLTQNLLSAQGNLLGLQNSLIGSWVNFQNQRLTLYRDLGLTPYDEWEAFDELFSLDALFPETDDPDSGGDDTSATG